jgi:hypothetical protein
MEEVGGEWQEQAQESGAMLGRGRRRHAKVQCGLSPRSPTEARLRFTLAVGDMALLAAGKADGPASEQASSAEADGTS